MENISHYCSVLLALHNTAKVALTVLLMKLEWDLIELPNNKLLKVNHKIFHVPYLTMKWLYCFLSRPKNPEIFVTEANLFLSFSFW